MRRNALRFSSHIRPISKLIVSVIAACIVAGVSAFLLVENTSSKPKSIAYINCQANPNGTAVATVSVQRSMSATQ